MKKTWILTPLLLGIAIWGCSGGQSSVGTNAEAPRAGEVSRSSGSVDDQLLTTPLEEIVESEEMSRTSPHPLSDDMQVYEGAGAPAEPTPLSGPAAGSGVKGVLVRERAKEAQAGRFQYGAGVNSDASVTGSIVVDERTMDRKVSGVDPSAATNEKAMQQGQRGYYSEAKKEAEIHDRLAPTPLGGGMIGGQGGADVSMPAGAEGYGSIANSPAPAAEPAARRMRVELEAVEASAIPFDQEADGNTIPGWINAANEAGKGLGPGDGGDKFEPIEENNFITVADQPLSTFSIDVDTASYSKIRSYLNQFGQLPPRDAVRVEELVNYFQYDYAQPTDEHPFAANVEVASCPWNPSNRLVRVGIKGKEVDTTERPASNIVFLLDVSGSMNDENKLPLLKKGMKMLVDQLGENDKVSIVVYAGAAGMVLEPTYGYDKAKILQALDRLQAGGSTNGGQGIELAYKTATENFITGGTNRVILCTDGDFNVGETSTGGLVEMAAEQAKKNIYLSILGFGIGNHNDSMLEQLSNKANGNYSFIDNDKEAKKVLVEQMSGTLLTIAKDVKIQIEFNPQKVASYRLVGYENRLLAAQDFNDDKKDAGEIGAGHTVTAFYEIVPVKSDEQIASVDPMVDELKYQTERKPTEAADSNELMTLKLRYKQPESDVSTLMTYPVIDKGEQFNQASGDFQFASAVAMFGLKLRGSHFHSDTNFAEIEELVASNVDGPGSSYREEFLELVRKVESVPK